MTKQNTTIIWNDIEKSVPELTEVDVNNYKHSKRVILEDEYGSLYIGHYKEYLRSSGECAFELYDMEADNGDLLYWGYI